MTIRLTWPNRARSSSVRWPGALQGRQGASGIVQDNTAAFRLEKELPKQTKSISCLKNKMKKLQRGRGLHPFDLLPSADMPLKLYGLIFK